MANTGKKRIRKEKVKENKKKTRKKESEQRSRVQSHTVMQRLFTSQSTSAMFINGLQNLPEWH